MRESLRQTVDRILAEFNAETHAKRRSGAVEEITDADIIEVDEFPYSSSLPGPDDGV
jgi:hypothetical protein